MLDIQEKHYLLSNISCYCFNLHLIALDFILVLVYPKRSFFILFSAHILKEFRMKVAWLSWRLGRGQSGKQRDDLVYLLMSARLD